MSDTMQATPPSAIGAVQAAFAAFYEGEPAVYVVQNGMARPVIKIDPAEVGSKPAEVTFAALLAPGKTAVAYYVISASTRHVCLWIADLTNNTTRVALRSKDNERFSDFMWSPSGAHIAYLRTTLVELGSNEKSVSQLWTAGSAPDSGEPRLVTGNEVIQLLGWSPDSNLIYYTRQVESAFTYSIFNLTTSEMQDVLLPDDFADQQNLNLLNIGLGTGTDSAQLAYVLHNSPYLQNAREAAVLVVNPNTGAIIKQFKTEGAATRFSFSPDLTWLAYDTLDFPEGTSTEPVGRSFEIRNLQDDTVRTLIPTTPDADEFKVLGWFVDPPGVFVGDENGKVEFVLLDGQRFTVAEGMQFNTGASVGGAGTQAGTISGAVVNLSVPYLHQVKMTPDNFDGNWACGPSSCTMVAGYYGKLPARDDTFGGNKSAYGWYISNQFASPATGYVFSRTDRDPQGVPFPGAYGHCVENGDGYGWRMADYLTKLGLKARCLTNGESYNDSFIKKYLDAGKPVVLSTMIQGFGHIVCIKGYMPDGRFIAADPYWSKVGVGETVYTRRELGNTPYLIVVDDDPPSGGAAPSTPVSQPATPSTPTQPATPAATFSPGSGGSESVVRRFTEAYNRGGAAASLGQPTGNIYVFNNRTYQEFKGGSRGTGMITLDERFDRPADQPLATLQPAFAIFGAFLNAWRDSYGGSGGVLGSPLTDEFINPQGHRQQSFEGGYILLEGTSDNLQGAFPWPENFNAWRAEYYNNAGLAGKPAFLRDEPPNATGGIGYDWGMQAPEQGKTGILGDYFSARFTRSINFGDGGNYELVVTADDGFRIFVDDQNLAQLSSGNPNQFWQITAPLTQAFRVTIGEGVHTIVLEYFEGERNAVINLDINPV